jgi:hypothetical protein
VSDVGAVGFTLGEETTDWNTEASWVRFGAGAKAGVGVTFSAEVGHAVTESYEVRVGRRTEFAGAVEPVKNDARTPEDEFALNAYSFTPYVYRERYNLNDKDAGLFVLMYAVGR